MLNLCAKSAAYADISLILRPTFRAAICLPISTLAEATGCYHQIKKKKIPWMEFEPMYLRSKLSQFFAGPRLTHDSNVVSYY